MRLLYGYGQRNQELRFDDVIAKSKNYSLLAAITDTEVVSYCMFEDSVKAPDYFCFIYDMAAIMDSKYDKWLLVIDIANIHKEKTLFKEALKCINLAFLPPYSPQFNPIELFFGDLKREVRKSQYSFITDLVYEVHFLCKNYDSLKLKHYHQYVYKELKRMME